MKNLILILSASLVVSFLSCKKESQEPVPGNANNGYSSISDFFAKNQPTIQEYSLNSTTGGSITGTQGTKITFQPNSFITQSWQPVSGQVTVYLQEIYKKKDMILAGIPTTSYGAPLASGGEYNIKVKQNNQELLLASGITYTAELPSNTADTAMQVYKGSPDSSKTTINWNLNNDSSNYVQLVQKGPSIWSFQMTCNSLNWTNCDHPLISGPTSTFSLTITGTNLASNYNNSTVYVIYPSKTACTLYGYNNIFTYWYMPTAIPVTVVVIQVDGATGKIYSHFNTLTASPNMTYTATMTETTDAALKAKLSLLD